MVTGPSASAAARSGGSRPSIRPVTTARPRSTASHCPGGDPPGQACGGRGRQPRYRGDPLAGRIRPLAIQPGQEVLPGQLRRRHPRQQLTRAETALPLLDRANRRIQRPDHASRPHSSLTAARPAFGVSDRSGAPIRTCCRFGFLPHILLTR
jgi:hypothetical protein